MSKSSLKAPVKETSFVGETVKKTSSEATPSEIEKAADEGRLNIRSGDLSTKVLEALAAKFGPSKVVNKIEECLAATKTMAIGGSPFEVPDFKVQLDALKLLLQYQVGMPVARTESIIHTTDTIHSLENKMQRSPALRRAVGRMLDRAKIEDGEVVDVGSTSQHQPLTDDEDSVAEEVLQSTPESPETPVETEVISRSMSDVLNVRGRLSVEEKLTR
jgi:hypothetical protein